MLIWPVVLPASATSPIDTLDAPPVLEQREQDPTAKLLLPVLLLLSA